MVSNEELVKEYRRAVSRKLKENQGSCVEDIEKTLLLKGELRAINKIIKIISVPKTMFR